MDALVQEGILGQEAVRGVGNVRLNPDPMLPGFSVGRVLDKTQAVADAYGIGHVTTDLDESLVR